MQLEAAHAVKITKFAEYVDRKEDLYYTGCQNTPTQHRLSSVTESQMPEDRSTERNEKRKGQYSGENKRKMKRQEDAWTIAT